MKEKGFTLVEMLAVIIVLGLIVTLVFPAVISTINSSKEKAIKSQNEIILKAAKMYFLDNPDKLPDLTANACKQVQISELKVYFANEQTGDEIKNNVYVDDGTEYSAIRVVYKTSTNQYVYEAGNCP